MRREEFEQILSGISDSLSLSSQEFVRLWNETWEKRSIGYFSTIEKDIEYISQMLGTRPKVELLAEGAESLRKFAQLVLTRRREDAAETLNTLRKSGYKSGLITNCAANIPSVWNETSLGQWIEAPVFSSMVGVRKPSREIYALACERLSLLPEQCIYVADGNDGELTGALAAGLNPVLFRAPDEDPYDEGLDRKKWTGAAISRLAEILELVN